MTTDPPDPIAAAAARYKRDNNKAKASRQELAELVLAALREPGAEPISIAKRAEWTPAYVRKLAREKGIEADPSYKARTEKARARLISEASTSPATATPRRQVTQAVPDLPDLVGVFPEVAALPYVRIEELAGSAKTRLPEWVEEIRREYPDADEFRLNYLIVNVGLRQSRVPSELTATLRPRLHADRRLTAEETGVFAARARSSADEVQAEKLDQAAGKASDGQPDRAVIHAALDMGLLSHDEVYGERPTSSEEASG